jgi:hypothetical protein
MWWVHRRARRSVSVTLAPTGDPALPEAECRCAGAAFRSNGPSALARYLRLVVPNAENSPVVLRAAAVAAGGARERAGLSVWATNCYAGLPITASAHRRIPFPNVFSADAVK